MNEQANTASADAADPGGALGALSVLDLSQFISGPYATKLFADYGADVLKVEPPGGDPARRLGPFPSDLPDINAGGLFLYLNCNKRSVTLDIETVQARSLLLELIPRFDVLVENFAPGYLDGLGLTAEVLRARNRSLVIARITAFGQSGPYRSFKDADLILQAASGLAHHNGDPEREPLRIHGYQAYYLGGAHAAVAILGAVQRRRATGEPQDVDVATALCAGNVIVPMHTSYAYNGVVTVRRAGGRGTFAVYPCADGAVSISVYSHGREWNDFVEMLDRPALRDPRFATAQGRAERLEEVESEILAWTIVRTKHELMEIGREHRIAVGMEATVADLFASPQLQARGFFVEVDHPVAGRLTQPGAPARLSATPWRIRRAAPLLGEHNAEVLTGDAGLGGEELARLSALGVL